MHLWTNECLVACMLLAPVWQLVLQSHPGTSAPILHAGTLLGCLPNNFVAVSAGSRLAELTSLKDLYDRRLVLLGVPCLGCCFC